MFNNIPNDEILPHIGEKDIEDGMPNVELNNIFRFEIPVNLIVGEATLDDIKMHGLSCRQRLSEGTVDKYLRSARFMMDHQRCSYNPLKPDFDSFMRYMDYREHIEKASSSALRHDWDAVKMINRCFGIPRWSYKPPRKTEPHMRLLPLPEVVHQFFHHKYSKDRYENALYKTLFKIGFLVGVRPPAELCAFKLNDININSDCTGGIVVTEVKKHNKSHPLIPRSQINRIFKNYLDCWRPKVENQYSGDSLFLWRSGKPITVRTIGHELSNRGKTIWKHFKPYDMRHWCGIARLIETKINSGRYDEFEVCDWLGHDDPKTTMDYIKYARMYYAQAQYNWIKRVLKFYKKHLIEKENTLDQQKALKPWFQVEPTDKARYGSTGIHTLLMEGFRSVKTSFLFLLVSQPLTKTFSFFLYKNKIMLGVGA